MRSYRRPRLQQTKEEEEGEEGEEEISSKGTFQDSTVRERERVSKEEKKEPTGVENVPEAGAAVRHQCATIGAGAGSLADLVTLVDVLGGRCLRVRHPCAHFATTELLARRALASLTVCGRVSA